MGFIQHSVSTSRVSILLQSAVGSDNIKMHEEFVRTESVWNISTNSSLPLLPGSAETRLHSIICQIPFWKEESHLMH